MCSNNSVEDYNPILDSVLLNQSVSSFVFIAIIVVMVGYFLKPLDIISSALDAFFKYLNYETKEPLKANVATKDEFWGYGGAYKRKYKQSRGIKYY